MWGATAESGAALASTVLVADGRSPRVTVQISAERAAVLCGVDEAIALLKVGAAEWSRLAVHALCRLLAGHQARFGQCALVAAAGERAA